jgi:purine/pyrimidine-nucleoside phosphorylase
MANIDFSDVTASAKANIYFDGKVISHTLVNAEGDKKTLGLIYSGKYHFGTELAEDMIVVAGSCTVKLDGSEETRAYTDGDTFSIPANSGFDITVSEGICEYVCSFVK